MKEHESMAMIEPSETPGSGPRAATGWMPFAFEVDAALVGLARGSGAIDLAIGECFVSLSEGDRLMELGYARLTDYARERLGVPARTMFFWTRLARELGDRPLLRRAVVVGKVTPRKALAVTPVATGDAEIAWTAAAMSLSLTDLEKRVRLEGAEPPTDTFEVETLLLRMTPSQQDRLDAAIEYVREVLGPDPPRWRLTEAVAMEWLGSRGEWPPEDGDGARPVAMTEDEARVAHEAWLEDWSEHGASIVRQLAVIEDAMSEFDDDSSPDTRGSPAGPINGARELDSRLRRLLEGRKRFDEPFGRLAELVSRHRPPIPPPRDLGAVLRVVDEGDLRYTPSDCFETFPFPENWETHPALEAAGKAHDEFRAALMVENDEGLTKTYNRFHDPDERESEIEKLRELHAAMDRAVLDAYGFRDIPTDCEFLLDYEIDEESWSVRRKKPWRYRWPDEVRDEVLARLLDLNAERAREEARAGLTRTKKRTTSPPPMGGLFS